MIPDSFKYHQYHLETLVVSEKIVSAVTKLEAFDNDVELFSLSKMATSDRVIL